MSSGAVSNFLGCKRRDSRNRVLADMGRAFPPDRQPFGMGMVEPRKPDHVIGVLLRVERADHVSPFSRPRDRDRAAARAIGQALDRHDLDVLPAIFEKLRQRPHETRAGTLQLILGGLADQAASDTNKQSRGAWTRRSP